MFTGRKTYLWCKKGKGGSLQRERLKNTSFSRIPCIAEEHSVGVTIQIYDVLSVKVSKHYIMGLKQEQWDCHLKLPRF